MAQALPIRYLVHAEIDKTKWDACITRADNGLIYAYSCYLDHMARHWDALVLGDYEAIMPLNWNRKYGIHYLYPPFLAAQLGVFGKNISGTLIESFLSAIPSRFLYWEMDLNYGNLFTLEKFQLHTRKNFVLDLSASYDTILNGYSGNIQRNIRKAQQAGCVAKKDFDPGQVIRLAAQQMKNYTKKSSENAALFRNLYDYLHERQQAITYGIFSAQDELIASCIFLFSHNRAYYILVGNHPDSRAAGASHALIDSFIKEQAGKKMLLDFEGSDIPGLAKFYAGFGAKEENYPAIKRNRLPFFIKWLKK